jgi:cell division protein FtsA
MSNKNFDVYVDLGSSKIRAGAFNKNNIDNDFYCESDYFLDQSNKETIVQKIIYDLEIKTNEYLDEINLMVDSPEMLSIGISLSKKLDGLELKKEDIQFLIQDAKQQILRNYTNLNIIHIIIKSYNIDNTNYIFPPININCKLLSLDIIFLCLPKKNIEELKKVFFKLDVSVKQIFCSSYAKSISYKNNFSSIKDISFIDVGFYKTSIINYKKNQINFFQTLPIGGHHITKDLSKILNIDLEDAEKIKMSFIAGDNDLKIKNLSYDLIQEIIISRTEEILRLCNKLLEFNNNEEQKQSKVVFIGSGSKILNDKFNKKKFFLKNRDLLEENTKDICQAALRLSQGMNKQEVVMVPKKQIKEGFFEKFFHFLNLK